MEWDKGDGSILDVTSANRVQVQVHDVRKSRNRTTLSCRFSQDDTRAADEQRCGITRGGGGMVWKHSLPRSQVVGGAETDVGEKVLLSARDPLL